MEDCTIYKISDIIGKKWTLVIVLEINKFNKIRFNHLKKNIPNITPKILSTRLKELETEALVRKEIDTKTIPIKAEYSLTESGKDFIKILHDLKQWALKWKFENKICEDTMCENCRL